MKMTGKRRDASVEAGGSRVEGSVDDADGGEDTRSGARASKRARRVRSFSDAAAEADLITAAALTRPVRSEGGSSKGDRVDALSGRRAVRRRELNRMNARKSRLRKKVFLEKLVDRVRGLETQISKARRYLSNHNVDPTTVMGHALRAVSTSFEDGDDEGMSDEDDQESDDRDMHERDFHERESQGNTSGGEGTSSEGRRSGDAPSRSGSTRSHAVTDTNTSDSSNGAPASGGSDGGSNGTSGSSNPSSSGTSSTIALLGRVAQARSQGHGHATGASHSSSGASSTDGTSQYGGSMSSGGVSSGASGARQIVEPSGPDLQLVRLLSIAHLSFIITDTTQHDNPIIFASRGFCDLTGYSPQEVIGKNCRFLQGPRTDFSVVGQLREAIQAGREVSAVLLNYRKDGSPFWNFLTIAPLAGPSGKVDKFIGIQSCVNAMSSAAGGTPLHMPIPTSSSAGSTVSNLSNSGSASSSLSHLPMPVELQQSVRATPGWGHLPYAAAEAIRASVEHAYAGSMPHDAYGAAAYAGTYSSHAGQRVPAYDMPATAAAMAASISAAQRRVAAMPTVRLHTGSTGVAAQSLPHDTHHMPPSTPAIASVYTPSSYTASSVQSPPALRTALELSPRLVSSDAAARARSLAAAMPQSKDVAAAPAPLSLVNPHALPHDASGHERGAMRA